MAEETERRLKALESRLLETEGFTATVGTRVATLGDNRADDLKRIATLEGGLAAAVEILRELWAKREVPGRRPVNGGN